MFKAITWGNYLAVTFTIVICYYAFIAILFYRNEINGLISSLKNRVSARKKSEQKTDQIYFDDLETKIKAIDSILLETGRPAGKEQLLIKIRAVLANYEGLLQPAIRVAVFNHIIRRSEAICGVRVSESDLE